VSARECQSRKGDVKEKMQPTGKICIGRALFFPSHRSLRGRRNFLKGRVGGPFDSRDFFFLGCPSRESGNPGTSIFWIPAFAGMTSVILKMTRYQRKKGNDKRKKGEIK
jgi:hypothetical protein